MLAKIPVNSSLKKGQPEKLKFIMMIRVYDYKLKGCPFDRLMIICKFYADLENMTTPVEWGQKVIQSVNNPSYDL